jgi:hypothetical protein
MKTDFGIISFNYLKYVMQRYKITIIMSQFCTRLQMPEDLITQWTTVLIPCLYKAYVLYSHFFAVSKM